MGTTKTTPTPPPYPHKNAENPWAKYQTSGCCLITSITVPLQPLPAHNHAGLRFVNHHHPTSKPYWLRINRKHPDPRRQHQLTTTSESTTKTNHDKTLLNRQRLHGNTSNGNGTPPRHRNRSETPQRHQNHLKHPRRKELCRTTTTTTQSNANRNSTKI
jgi:hypothetical protein